VHVSQEVEQQLALLRDVFVFHGVVQCAAGCCTVLQCVAVCCSVLQYVAVCVAESYFVLQRDDLLRSSLLSCVTS